MASNNTIENDCFKALSQQRLFDLGCLAPALALILVLASLKQRTKFKLEWFDGRPGLLIPVDLLGSHSNRWTVVATYGATASTILALLLIGKKSGIIVSESPWLNIFNALIAVLIYGILFYPFFACLSTEYKLVGSLLGFVYGALRLSFQLATQIRCCIVYKDFTLLQLLLILPRLPTDICLIFIVARFAVLLSLRFRQRWLQSAESDSNSSSLVKEPDIIHVKLTLGQGSPYYSDGGKWFLKLLYFIYRPRTDFKFSTQLISTVLLAGIAIFEILLLEVIFLENFKEYMSYVFGIKPFRLLQGCFHGAYVLSALMSLITMLHFLKCHRDHVLQLCRGQRGFMQNVCLSPASFVGRSLSFTGYQIAHALWGFLVWSFLFFVLFCVPAFLLAYKDAAIPKFLLEGVWSITKSSIPSAVMALFLWTVQRIFLARWVFRDRDFPNLTVTIDNRRLFSILSYVFVFLNVIVGLFSCLLRMLKGMILGLFFLSRLDKTCLMQGFQRWDKGFLAYLGFITVLVAHRHPVMLVFCQLLIDKNKVQQPDKVTESQHPSHAKEAKGSAAYSREVRSPRLSQKAVNRWLLAVTLHRNPSLKQHRRQWYSSPIAMSEADTASITVSV